VIECFETGQEMLSVVVKKGVGMHGGIQQGGSDEGEAPEDVPYDIDKYRTEEVNIPIPTETKN